MYIWMYSIGANQTTFIQYSFKIYLFEKCDTEMELPKVENRISLKKLFWCDAKIFR